MKSPRRRLLLLGALALPVLLGVIAALLLPRLVDPESYRELLRSKLERQLGRAVAFGAMDLSLWPVLGLQLNDLAIGRTPDERFDNPVVAESLRVGARLLPLLRGRLEITSLIVEGPLLTVYRRGDGIWEPLPTRGDGDAGPATATAGPPLLIDRLQVRHGRVVLRHDDAGGLRETTLADLALRLDGLGAEGPVSFDLSAGLGPSGTLRAGGTFQPARLQARVAAADVAPTTLLEWLAALAPGSALPGELRVDRPFSASATIDYTTGRPAQLAISDAVIRGPGVLLVRSASGAWNSASVTASDPAEASGAGPEALSIRISSLMLDDGSIRIEDRSAQAEPAVFEISPLHVELRQPRPEAPLEIEIQASGGTDGRAALKARLDYQPASEAGPARVRGEFAATGIDPRDLRLASTLASLPPGLIVGRRFGVSAEVDAILAETPDVTLRNVMLQDLDLAVDRNGPVARSPSAHEASPRLHLRAERVELTDATLGVTDRRAAGAPAVLNLSALRLSLDRLPTDGPAALELDARVGPGKESKLALRGTLGPLGDDPVAMPLDLAIQLRAIDLGDVRRLLPAPDNLDVSNATGAANLSVSGTFLRELAIVGDVSLANATVSLVSPHGDARKLPLDLQARGKLGLRESAARIELSNLDLEFQREGASRKLTLRGSVNTASTPPRLDLELLPTRVAADDLAALAALLAPAAPLTFASPDPVELELRARGPLGGEKLPDLDGKATLTRFTFRVAGMTQPMERVASKVTFSPSRVTLDGFEGAIGKSDVTASRVVVTNFDAPAVQVELNSRNADFWELFSFVETDDAAAPAAGDDALSRATIAGTLRIEQGTLQTLAFEKLTTGLDFRNGVLSLAPLEMDLYGGRFSGKLVQDLDAGVLTISGDGAGVDADGFLAQNLQLGGVISGRASTQLGVQVRGADPANLLAGVSGGGPLQLIDGRLAKLDVLKSLSKVTGILGERSLQRLTRQLATAGTPFRRAETRLGFDSGKLAFEDLVIETAELTLAGRASLDSATEKLDGRFTVAFSPELSAVMREEHSRAASLFWDPKVQRVRFGFGVGGTVSAPSVSVDWNAAVRGVVERKLEDRLPGLLQPKPTGESATASADAGLVAQITGSRWAGPALMRDLSLEGTAGGSGVERASLSVVDARGIEVQKIDRLRTLDDQLASVADPDAVSTYAWSAKIDGKRLLAARFPVKVTLTVYDRQGGAASATRDVER